MTLRANVLIPAWNEAGVIAQTLAAIRDPRLHLIVIANACTDATAAVARAAAPQAVVLETPVPGKTHAMNLGLTHAMPGLPVVCLDADLATTPAMILDLIAPLETPLDTHLAACGRMQIDAAQSSPMVRAYMRAWAHNPYFAQGKFGGLFALSAKGAAQVFPLPYLTADDEYIRRSFARHETAFVPSCVFVARAPRDLATLIRVRRRSLRGARAVAAKGLRAPGRTNGGVGTMLRAALIRPARWPDLAVFVAVMALVRVQLALEPRAAKTAWERDTTNRPSEVAQ